MGIKKYTDIIVENLFGKYKIPKDNCKSASFTAPYSIPSLGNAEVLDVYVTFKCIFIQDQKVGGYTAIYNNIITEGDTKEQAIDRLRLGIEAVLREATLSK